MSNHTTVKLVANNISEIHKVVKVRKTIYGDLGQVESYRTRKVWAIKRSPHVFSKSQESFGYEVYHGLINLKSGGPVWPVSFSRIVASLSHVIPGLHWSFTKTQR
jgi:ribosomal protein S10